MVAATPASRFLDRNRERQHLDALLADVRAGRSARIQPFPASAELYLAALKALEGEIGVGRRVAGVAS